ncbi:MAG: sensor histidine kinase [Jatrophihabitantaceae bacterium]
MNAARPLRRAQAALADRVARLSLRRRLVLLLLTLLLISCALIAIATTLALRHFLIDRLDQQLTAAGNRYAISLEHPSDGDADNPFSTVAGQSAGTLGARVLHGTVTSIGLVTGSDQHAIVSAADRARIASLSSSGSPRSVDLPGLGDYRVIVQPGRDGDLLVTGLPQRGVDDTIGRLALIDAAVFALVLLATGLIGAISVRLSLRPLTRVTDTARQVAGMPLASGAVALPERPATAAPDTEVGQLSGAFNHMLDHVEASLSERHSSEQRLRHFIADASHELRTPLAVIRSHAEHAQRVGATTPGQTQTALSRITAESARMGHLVDDLLLLARLDSGRPLDHAEVDLTRLVIDAVNDARITSSDHRWELDLPDEPVLVRGDEHRLQQAIANLVSNARIHTPPGTTVIAHVIQDGAGNEVEIRIADDGPGIGPDILPHIFERFMRGDAGRSRTTGTTGLGLPISEAIIRAHQGTIHVDSVPGHTNFAIRLPAPRQRRTAGASGTP